MYIRIFPVITIFWKFCNAILAGNLNLCLEKNHLQTTYFHIWFDTFLEELNEFCHKFLFPFPVSDRSRNASTASGHQIPDSKIFSVAVEAKAKEPQTGLDSMMVCDVDTDYTGRFAVVSSEKTPKRVKHVPPSKELRIDENLDQVVSSLPEVILMEYT